MTAADNASWVLLTRTALSLKGVGGLSRTNAIIALTAVTSVIRSRHQPISERTAQAIEALIESVRDDIVS